MRRTIVGLATLGFLLTPTACEGDVWRYEMSAKYTNGTHKEIGGRYEYGVHAGKFRDDDGNWTYAATTSGPKNVKLVVNAKPSGAVHCEIVIKKNGQKVGKVTSDGKNSTSCTFRP